MHSVTASVEIRPPRDSEWPVVRMLLPGRARYPLEYLLAFDSAAGVAGAAAFACAPGSVHTVRIRVIRTERRKGIGRMLLAAVEARARAGGINVILVRADAKAEPDAGPFLIANGFQRVQRLTSAEAAASAFRESIARLRRRLENRIPGRARIIVPGPDRIAELSDMFERMIVHDAEAAARIRSGLAAGRFDQCVAIEAEGRIRGMLLAQQTGQTATVCAKAVDPGFRGGWANVMLMSVALEKACSDGVREVRFDWMEGNHDTEKLAARMGASILAIFDVYRKELL